MPDRKMKILDIGGGSGRFAIPLTEMGHCVTVIDINEEALSILCNRNDNIEIINDNFEKFKNDGLFDMVLMIETISYFSDLSLIFNKIHSMINVGANVIFTAPNANSLKYKIRQLIPHYHYPGVRDYKTYKKLLIDCGFEIVDINAFNWLPFRVNTNSLLVPFFAEMEQVFHLNRWLTQGPELLFCARKIS
jgi:2-polyprenyl-3-methyl-5-hydroxy-6-metoxy-1,4-benzoquinol methylase